jgi:carbon storage regulator
MLVLSRKKSESLLIGGNIRVRILGIKGKAIRLGIEAPRSVPVRREDSQLVDTTGCRGGLRLGESA